MQALMDMLAQRGPGLWLKTGEHLVLTGSSIGIAVLIGLPLGILIRRRPALRHGVLSVSGVVQTIPSLALLAFMLPCWGSVRRRPSSR